MKALPIKVFKDGSGDCTNGGISSRYDTLLLVCEDGYIDIDEANPPENLVKIVTRKFSFGTFKHIEPVASTAPGCVGWMAGGNIGYTSDSRFRRFSDYPLNIHDRQEGQAMYDSFIN